MKSAKLDKLMNIMNIKDKKLNAGVKLMTRKEALSRENVLLYLKNAGYSKIPNSYKDRKAIFMEILKLPSIYKRSSDDSERVVKDEYPELLKKFLIANGYPKFIPPTPLRRLSSPVPVRKSSVATQIIRR